MESKRLLNIKIEEKLKKEKKSFFVWLSHDVDWVRKDLIHSLYYTYKQKRIYHLKEIFFKEHRYWNFDKIMELEAKYNAKSTFFFLHETMSPNLKEINSLFKSRKRYSFFDKKIQAEIKKVDRSEWEVGLHGSYYSYANIDLLKMEKKLLENILGKNIIGSRQHYLNLKIPETWEFHNKLGFKYDSSFGAKNDVGFKDNIYYPFKPLENDFTVFPLSMMEGYLEKISKNNITLAKKIIDNLINTAIKKKTILSILWHNRSIDYLEFPNLYSLYVYILEQTRARNGEFILPKMFLNEKH